jgi:hypothetical protein
MCRGGGGKGGVECAVEQDRSLKPFFHYCIALCSLGIAGAVTVCNVAQLWTNSIYNISLPVVTQHQFHLQQYAFQAVLSNLNVSCLQKLCYQNMYNTVQLQYTFHCQTENTFGCTLTALLRKLSHTLTVYRKHSSAVVHNRRYSRIYFTLCDL